MPNSPKIRIRQSDKSEYNRLLRNTKAKIKRVNQKHNTNVQQSFDLPFQLKDLSYIQTRDEYNRQVEGMKRFTDRRVREFQYETNKYGVTANRRELNDNARKNRSARIRAQRKIDEMKERPYNQKGKEVSTIGERTQLMKEPDATGINMPATFNFDYIRSRKDLKKNIEMNQYRTRKDYYTQRQQRMKDNYIKTLEQTINSDEETDQLIKELKDLTPEQFFYLYQENDELDFSLMYYPDGYWSGLSADNQLGNQISSALASFKDRYQNEMSFIP